MKTVSDNERLQAAQKLIEQLAREYGVTIIVQNTIKRVDDGSVLVIPAVSLQLIENWKASDES